MKGLGLINRGEMVSKIILLSKKPFKMKKVYIKMDVLNEILEYTMLTQRVLIYLTKYKKTN
jgi:hypothetical protein